MKIYLSQIGRPHTEKPFEVPVGLSSKINLLILVHLLFFLAYSITAWAGLMNHPVAGGTLADFITSSLALSRPTDDGVWLGSVFTHQFVHFNAMELLLSMSILWLFGHLLRNLLSERKILVLYLMSITLSAIAFVLSHFVFSVFTGHGTVMEGAFAGAVGVMTTAVIFFRSHQIRIFKKLFLPVWQLYAVVLIVCVALIIKPSIAYVIVYLSSIWLGGQYAISRLR